MSGSRSLLASSLSGLTGLLLAHSAMGFGFWQGPTDGDWFAGENWSPMFVPPTADDDVYIDSGGSAVVSAPGALGGTVYVGTDLGTGTLTVRNGGTGVVGGMSIAADSLFTVTGTGSEWNVTGSMFGQGSGSKVLVSGGGKLTSGSSSANDFFDYGAEVTVTGTGTFWTSRSFVSLYTGTASFLDHSTISTGRFDIGLSDDNVGTVNVSGGTQWTAVSLTIGFQLGGAGTGSATLNLTDGASLVTTRNRANAIAIGSSGRLNIGTGGIAGTLTMNGASAGITFSPAGGTVAFNHTDDVVFSSPIAGEGQVLKDGSGTTTLSGMSTFTGSTIISEGTLHLTGIASGSVFTVEASARLSGNGTAGMVVLEPDGLLTPGALFSSSGGSAGLLTIGSGSTFEGHITLELGGLTRGSQYDAINVSGTGMLTLGGDLNVTLINGFTPAIGDSFQLFDADDFGGSFETLNLPALSSGAWDSSQLNTSGIVSVVPEPASCALLAAASLVAGLRRRRTR